MLKFYQLKANDNLKSAALQWPGWFLRYYAGNGHTYHRFRSPEVQFTGDWTDLLYAEEGWLVASDALRKALEAEKKPEEIIHFLPLQVSNGNETRAYWLVHFPYRKDVYAWRKWQYDDEMALIHQPPLDEECGERHGDFLSISPSRRLRTSGDCTR